MRLQMSKEPKMTSCLVVERNDAGSCIIYQTQTDDWQTLPNLLGESDMYVVDLPRSLEGNLAFELVKRHLRLDQTAQGATGKLSLQQVDDLITWMRRVIEAVDPRWANRP